MQSNKAIGDLGEEIAARYLTKRGWKILARNYKVNGGELDIVGYRLGALVYFEVKTRSGERFGRPADAVDGEKLYHLKSAVRVFNNAYVRGGRIPVFYPLGITVRRPVRRQTIDIIEIYLSRDGRLREINHIKKAEIL